jgi:hypothetical protein
MQRQRGFALIGVMIAAAILAIFAAIALPGAPLATLAANEAAAIATLRNIAAAQNQCRALGVIEVNSNGHGEFGFFGELAGNVTVRVASGVGSPIVPPLLSAALGRLRSVGALAAVQRAGYYFRMFLPVQIGALRTGVTEVLAGGDPTNSLNVTASAAESLWSCYAWPQLRGVTGNQTFFINQPGVVLATKATVAPYSSSLWMPSFRAAISAGRSASMDVPAAAGSSGQDGNFWYAVQ